MTIFKIPLSPDAQKFAIALAGVEYQLGFTWGAVSSVWLMDIFNASGKPLATSIPLVANTNLLEQFEYLGISGKIYAYTDGDPDTPPTYSNLGVSSHLYYEAT